jgi:hydroxymethylpyrimidine/phosphomethylpyrimidine kinase
MLELPGRRVPTRNTHGTGCSYSAAIAALLPQRGGVALAVREAHAWLARAIAAADQLDITTTPDGHGPVHHFHAWWN